MILEPNVLTNKRGGDGTIHIDLSLNLAEEQQPSSKCSLEGLVKDFAVVSI